MRAIYGWGILISAEFLNSGQETIRPRGTAGTARSWNRDRGQYRASEAARRSTPSRGLVSTGTSTETASAAVAMDA
jgi:hypothetical protein